MPELWWVMAPRLNSGMICGEGIKPLRKLFLDLFSIARVKDALVADHLEFSTNSHW
jgi:hypothetical protein